MVFKDETVVLHGRERIVVVVKGLLPFQILRRLPESLGVGLQGFPASKEKVAAFRPDAALQLMRQATRGAAQVSGCGGEIPLKCPSCFGLTTRTAASRIMGNA
jgi:hypothetical protein